MKIERILISVMVAHGPGSCGQVDDSSARLIEQGLKEFNGVRAVDARVLYEHTKQEEHTEDCACGICSPARSHWEAKSPKNLKELEDARASDWPQAVNQGTPNIVQESTPQKVAPQVTAIRCPQCNEKIAL